jgi:hypothetical protein
MNSKIFEKWVNEQLEPVLPPKSLVVMDNASYHSVREEGTKAPTPNSLKGDIINWLEKNYVPFDKKGKKTELYEIIKSKKQAISICQFVKNLLELNFLHHLI